MEVNEKSPKKKKGLWIALGCVALAVVIIVIILLLSRCGFSGPAVTGGELAEMLAQEGTATITLDEDVYVEGPLVVNGNKTIEGDGKIILQTPLEGDWPEAEAPTWGMGCQALEAADGTKMPAFLTVSNGASLTLGGNVTVDANNNGNGVRLDGSGKLTVNSGTVQNGRYANLVVGEKAKADLAGGNLLDGKVYNVVNYGKVDLSGTNVSGAEAGAAIYTTGQVEQTGGNVADAAFHNVYVAAGTYTMSGGTNDGAAKDGIMVAQGAKADVTGGTITNCVHGLCNNGELNSGAVTLNECGIMNYETGVMDLVGTTVDTSEVYCLANNGGKVTAKDFTAKGCDTCAVYNFSGDMNLTNLTVTGSRDGNITNAGGNLTVDGAMLDVCRDKSVTVGNGVATLNNVTIAGTTNEKYGVYAFGGELYLNDSTVENVSSTAVKLDAGSYVELNNVSIKDAAQNGIQADGGKLVGSNVTMENMGSHGIYNKGGEITVNGIEIDTVKKNGVQQKDGNTTLVDAKVENTGNHGAYLETGTLSVKGGQFDTMAANGFYVVKGDNKLVLEKVTISNTVQQGINNNSNVELKNVTIQDTGKNGIYNKAGGVVTVSGATISDVAEHGINNKATMTASNVTVKNSGANSNGIQNNGTMKLDNAAVTASKKHGIYNNGTLTANLVTITTTGDNGIYNDKGTATIANLTVTGTTGQGVNNNSQLTLTDTTIVNAGKNGVYNSDGKAKIDGLSVNGAKEHGINNVAEMNATEVVIKNTGAEKNGIQNSGKLSIDGCDIAKSQNHGIYNIGSLTGKEVKISDTDDNGIYNTEEGVAQIETLTITKADGQGVNNNAQFTASNVTVSNTGKNGVYNNAGTLNISGLKVTNPGEHGLSNNTDSVATVTGATLDGSGDGSNNIQNKGTLNISNVSALNSSNHGIYNDAVINATGTVSVTNSAANGIYNYGGQVDMQTVKIVSAGSHGVNNTGTLEGDTFAISGVAENGFQNNGEMTVTSSATITGSGKHGIFNGDILNGKNITVTSAGDLLASNAGDMVIDGFKLSGAANKALYNSGYAELYTVTVDGTAVTHDYLIDNNGGILDLTDATIQKAVNTAIQNRGQASTSVTNVIIDHVGNYGIFVEGGSVLSGDGLVINHVTKTASGAEGTGIKLAGTVTMMDHVTLGDYAAAVTGSGEALADTANSGIAGNAIQVDATAASYSGYDLVVKNTKGAAVYNKGKLFVTNLYADGVKEGVYSNYEGAATLSGDNCIYNVTNNAVRHDSATASLVLSPNATLTADGIGGHGINNKGIVNADVTSKITIKNIQGKNVNAVNNNGGTMTLGDVEIDGMQVYVSMYNTSTINSNSGNGIQTNSTLVLNGTATIKNVYLQAANNKTENSNGSGVVVKGNGNITGTGSIHVIGPDANTTIPEGYTALHNGIFTSKCSIDIDGDISVSGAKNQGIYAADANAKVAAKNITVTDCVASANGIYVNNATGNLIADEKLTITGTAGGHALSVKGTASAKTVEIDGCGTGKQTINLDGNKAVLTATNVSAKNSGGNGVYINNAAGQLNVSGTLSIDTTVQHGINNKGKIKAGTIEVKNAATGGNADHNGITNQSNASIDVTHVKIDGVTAGMGIKTVASFRVRGSADVKNINNTGIHVSGHHFNASGADVSVSNITGTDANAVHVAAGKNMTVDSLSINNVKLNTTTAGFGNGIYLEGTMTINESATITNLFNVAVGNDYGAGVVVRKGGYMKGNGNLTVTATASTDSTYTKTIQNGIFIDAKEATSQVELGGDIRIENVLNQGIYLANSSDGLIAKLTAKDVTVKNVGGNGVYNRAALSEFTATGAVTVDNTKGHGVSNDGTFRAAGISVNNAKAHGINNGGTMTVTGEVRVTNVTSSNRNGVANGGTMTVGGLYVEGVNITISSNDIFGNGVFNKGTLTVNGDATIKDVKGASNISSHSNKAKMYNGLYNTKTVKVTGTLTVDTVATNYGIYSTGGSIEAANVVVKNINNIGIFLEGGAKLEGYNVTVQNVKGQGIQANHANTITIETLTMNTVSKNGLRLYNNSANPTVTIGTIVASNIGEWAVAAAKNLTTADVTIGTVYHENCTGGAVHGRVTSCVTAVKPMSELPVSDSVENLEQAPEATETTEPTETTETTPTAEETTSAVEETTTTEQEGA